MAKYKNKYRIESNRLKYWDYSSCGYYFLTVCIQNRACILGNVVNGEIRLSSSGEIVKSEIEKIPTYHKRIILDEWVVMPNHFIIIELADYDFDNGMCNVANDGADDDDTDDGGMDDGDTDDVKKIHEFSLPTVTIPSTPSIHALPTYPSQSRSNPQVWWDIAGHQPTHDEIKQYRRSRRKMMIPKIMGKMKMITSKQINIIHNTPGKKNWQPNYHNHVIRDDKSYDNISNYIINNPKKWKDDGFNPKKS